MTAIPARAQIHLILHKPQTEAGQESLARQVADIHAAAVIRRIQSLNCPARQKLALLDSVMETIRNREQT